MSAPHLNIRQTVKAFDTAGMIGLAARHERKTAGRKLLDVSFATGVAETRVSAFERGREKNVKLGTLVRLLDAYGLELAVVRKERVE